MTLFEFFFFLRSWFPHNYEVTAFEAYFDMWTLTGNQTYLNAINGAWDMFRESFLHVGGSMAINEGSNGTNTSSGLWYPPKSYYLEGDNGDGFQKNGSKIHQTGETCGSVFWIKLNQRYHYHFPTDVRYVYEIERSLLNIGIANQSPSVGSTIAGVRSFAFLHGQKNFLQHNTTCCEGQGTRLHGSLPEYLYSLMVGGQGISVDIYMASTIQFDVVGVGGGIESESESGESEESNNVALQVESSFPVYYEPTKKTATTTVTVAHGSGVFVVRLRIPSWATSTTAKSNNVVIRLNDNATFEIGQVGSYVEIKRQWSLNDVLSFTLPMQLISEQYVGLNQINGTERWSIVYGPTLLVARNTTLNAWDDEMECIPLRDVNPTTPEKWLVQMDPALLEGNVRMKFLPTKESGIVGVEFVPYFDVNDEWFTSYPCYM